MNLKKELKNNNTLLVVFPNQNYNNKVIEFVKKISQDKFCYVSINKSYASLISSLKKSKINVKDFFFIDCVTRTVTEPKKIPKNCLLLPSPKSITEINLAITKIAKSDHKIIFLDSLSTLSVYHSENILKSFVHKICNQIRNFHGKLLILAISSKDENSGLFQEVEMIVDKVIKVK